MQASHAPSDIRKRIRRALGKGLKPRCIPETDFVLKPMAAQPATPRRFRITIRLTAGELHQIEDRALAAGLRVSGYARRVLVQAKPQRAARRPAVAVPMLVQALGRLGEIAYALSQIAARVSVLPGVERDLLKSLAELGECRVAVLAALSRRIARP